MALKNLLQVAAYYLHVAIISQEEKNSQLIFHNLPDKRERERERERDRERHR